MKKPETRQEKNRAVKEYLTGLEIFGFRSDVAVEGMSFEIEQIYTRKYGDDK